MELTVGKLKEMLEGISDDTPLFGLSVVENGRGLTQADNAEISVTHYKDGETYNYYDPEEEDYEYVTDVVVLSVSGQCTHDE